MLSAFLRKRHKILNGWARTLRGDGSAYSPDWWDRRFFLHGVSDRVTIWHGISELTSAYHYASVETLILRELLARQHSPRRVFDIGSGAGHWLDFYANLGAEVSGVDVSAKCVEHLRGRYDVHLGKATDALPYLEGRFDLINAIGVMFHIVDDAAWRETLAGIHAALRPGGLLVVGGHFGWLDGVNVQWDEGRVNKRLRSRWNWTRTLRGLGFDRIRIRHNLAYLTAPEPLPENSLLFARKPDA